MEKETNLSEHQKKSARMHYLEQFKMENKPSEYFNKNLEEIGVKILDMLKKEDLTHEQAYASLQYVYNLIKYESNFLKL